MSNTYAPSWRLVPVEPTADMLRAAADPQGYQLPVARYRALLEAAPATADLTELLRKARAWLVHTPGNPADGVIWTTEPTAADLRAMQTPDGPPAVVTRLVDESALHHQALELAAMARDVTYLLDQLQKSKGAVQWEA